MQKAEPRRRCVRCPWVFLLTHLKLWMLVHKVGLATQPTVGRSIASREGDRVAGDKPNPFFMAAITKQLQRIVAVGDQLMDVSPGTIPDRMRPFDDVIAPLLRDAAVIHYYASLKHCEVYEGVHAAVRQLIYVEGEV